MSQKKEKKMRQLFRREIRSKVDELTIQHFKDGDVYKQKPKWCPAWLWSKIMHLIIDDVFYVKYENYKKQQGNSDQQSS